MSNRRTVSHHTANGAGTWNGFATKMLDVQTPSARAKLDNGALLLEHRMQERGISPPENPGGFFQ